MPRDELIDRHRTFVSLALDAAEHDQWDLAFAYDTVIVRLENEIFTTEDGP